jgi:hypothetical protein
MSRKANYSEFQTLPSSWTRAVWSGDKIENESDPFKWSGRADPPVIGARVHAYMNKLGSGTVRAYFVEYGWLGVLVQLDKNPAWRRKQLQGNPPAHLFGIDLEKREPAPTMESAARAVMDGEW